jgi:hypothetical protein
MTPNSPIAESRSEPLDALDRLLADYFKSQLKEPWPSAPASPRAEASVLVATRAIPLACEPLAQRDSNSRARVTLAASVALLLGTCWYFTSGFESADRNVPGNPSRGGVLGDAGASKPDALEELKHDNAIKGDKAPARPPMQLP